jgi:RHS repeat-associated protein
VIDLAGIEAAGEEPHPSAKVVSRKGDVVDRSLLHWEGLDRLVSRSDSSLGETKYLHDARGRLAAASFRGGTTEWRAPDATGNLFKTEDRSDRRYGKGGVLLEADGASFAYDALGNVIEKALPDGRTWKYAWNAAGFLAEVVTPEGRVVGFTYDALGRRVSKTVDGDKTTRWLWNGDVPMHEWTESGGERGALTTWVFEPDGFTPLGKVTSDGERLSIVSDYLGTPAEMFDAAGRLAWKAQLDLYGVPKVDKGAASDCPWRWQGQYEDEETGLYYNRFRYYDPQRGDYISQDPTRLWGLSPGATLYSYTGDPLIWIDVFALNGVIYLRILKRRTIEPSRSSCPEPNTNLNSLQRTFRLRT